MKLATPAQNVKSALSSKHDASARMGQSRLTKTTAASINMGKGFDSVGGIGAAKSEMPPRRGAKMYNTGLSGGKYARSTVGKAIRPNNRFDDGAKRA